MTAMQELLVHFNEMNQSGWFSMDEVEQAILDHGIPLEKEQIIDAYYAGTEQFDNAAPIVRPKEPESYYNDLFYAHQPPRPAT
jgi:hypothetical protein